MENPNQFIGRFIESELQVAEKLKYAKAFIFDWDGVFNNGFKQGQSGSGFSEVDSMGTNLLRFSHYLVHGKTPITAIISGEKNDSAQFFAEREHFDFAFYKIAHKTDALSYICREKNIEPDEVVYFFDDVLDLSIAKICGLRIMIGKNATTLFTNYCIKNDLVDYVSHNDGLNHGIRESCEMLMTLHHNFDEVLKLRTDFSDEYKRYLELRNSVNVSFFTKNAEGKISKG